MTLILTKLKNFILKYYLIIFGLIVFSLYFWSRFLRSHTSKELPFNLSIMHFFSLLYICIIFSSIIIFLLLPRKKNDIIEKIIDWLFIPLSELDDYIKNSLFIKPYYERFIKYFILTMEPMVKSNAFLLIFWFIPQFLLLIVLYIDVFYFYKLHYKYYLVYFGLLLFFNRYFRYSLKKYKKQLFKKYEIYINTVNTPYVKGIHPSELEPDYDPTDPDEEEWSPYMALPFETFIEFQTQSMIYQNITRKIMAIRTTMKLTEKLWKELYGFDYPDKVYFKIKGNYIQYVVVSDKCEGFAEKAMKEILQVSLILEHYNKYNTQDKRIRNIKILIYLSYLLCWLYILIISIYTLDIEELNIVLARTWLLLQDPFADIYTYEM